MRQEKVIKHLYDYAYLMKVMNETEDMPNFNSPKSFTDKKGIDANEARRRNAVGSRFLSIYRKAK